MWVEIKGQDLLVNLDTGSVIAAFDSCLILTLHDKTRKFLKCAEDESEIRTSYALIKQALLNREKLITLL